ncbi:MAG: insulinase family protein [Clostridia bacterium]|nr:insulinase family protein [Clostridia bacterium]
MDNITQKIHSAPLDLDIYNIRHKSGTNIIVIPMENYSSAFAIFGTHYGSVDNCFKLSGEEDFACVPDGIAHFLEHKLFENEQCGAFERYAKTGADANAFTSYDKTCYLFSCTENFDKSLEILLDFVTHPYFTPETVEKEQGIIGQEIKMYDDSPGWQLLLGITGALYKNHSVRTSIAGTAESISKITPEHLYRCYNAFYAPKNMMLCVCGNVDVQKVVKIADKNLAERENPQVERFYGDEPVQISCKRTVNSFDVPIPLFAAGYKLDCTCEAARENIMSELFIEMVSGKYTQLFADLLGRNLITEGFYGENFCGPGYRAILFEGQSADPDEVKREIDSYILKMKTDGADKELFRLAKKTVYGNIIENIETAAGAAHFAADLFFDGTDIDSYASFAADVTLEDFSRWLCGLDIDNSALSIVKKED